MSPVANPGRIVPRFWTSLLALVVVVLVGCSAIFFSHLVLRQFRELFATSITPMFETARAMEQAIVHNRNVYEYLAESDPEVRIGLRRNIDSAAAAFSREFAEVRWAGEDAGYEIHYKVLQNLWREYLVEAGTALELRDSGSIDAAVDRMLATARPLFRELRDSLSDTMLTDHEEALRSFARTEALFVAASVGIGGLVGGFALVVAGLAYQRRRYDREARQNLELLATLRERDSLYSVIAHDLRSPFTPVLGFLEELSKCEADADRAEMIGLVRAFALEYFETLQDLLVWAQDQRGNLVVRRDAVELRKLVDGVVALLERVAALKHLRIDNRLPEGLAVRTDRRMLASVVRNLLANAIKYSKSDSRVVIEGETGSEGRIALTVRDSGVGMTPEKIRAILGEDPVESRPGTTKEKGHGLGLYLTRLFIRKLGGSLSCESMPGAGTAFTVELRDSPRDND